MFWQNKKGCICLCNFIYLLVCVFVGKMPTQCVFEIHPIMNGEWIRIYVNIY